MEGNEESSTISEASSSHAVPVQLIIKFSDNSVADLALDIPNISIITVSDVRRQIRDTVGGKLSNRRLRLIHGGKVLSEKVNLGRDVVKVNPKGKGTSGATTTTTSGTGSFPRRVYLHCSVGDILDAAELARENELDSVQPVRSTAPELRGFDRLRNAGFSEQDVAQLRRQFSSLHGTSTAQGGEGAEGIPNASREEELTRLEEQWINTGVADAGINTGADQLANALGDDYLEELIGLLVGMFLGILAVIFLKEGSGVFSRRQRRSILAGVAINCSFALVRMFN